MTDFRTWWNFRDGKEMTLVGAGLLVIALILSSCWDPEEKDPNICTNLCIVDKNGIPRYQSWFDEHPEDLPEK